MSLPAASAPVAVLVLAWDETTPVVRALVEAAEATAPAQDSVVVLVPASPTTNELTPEEFLPLPDSVFLPEELPGSAAVASEPLPVITAQAPAPDNAPATLLPAANTPPAIIDDAATPTPALPSAAAIEASSLLLVVPSALGQASRTALTAAALDGPAVRMPHLSEHSLAALVTRMRPTLSTWLGTVATPAAPYLGSSVPAGASTELPGTLASVSAPGSMPGVALVSKNLPLAEDLALPPIGTEAALSYLPAELLTALDAEPDRLPLPAAERLAPTASASSTALSEKVASELDTPLTVAVTPVQTQGAEALAPPLAPTTLGTASQVAESAAVPSPSTEAAPSAALITEEAAPIPAALRPASSQFDAPNLNFQVIQYARFAVPLALAAQPFAVIYAPAWPTWLAAQELRQRTGQPLVLHIASLAAEDEPLALATGWPAEIQRQALHRADLILTETPALAYRLRRELNLPAHRVRPVPAADATAITQALGTIQVPQPTA